MREIFDLEKITTVIDHDKNATPVIANVSKLIDIAFSDWTSKSFRGNFRLHKRLMAACITFLIDAKPDTDVVNTERGNEDYRGFVGELIRIRNN